MSLPCLRGSSLHGQAYGGKAMKGRWQTVGRVGKLAAGKANGAPSGARMPRDRAVSCAWLLDRRDERAPSAGGHAEHVAGSVFAVSHQDGVGRGGDFYALAAVGA
jgi:hypothetical protein